MELYERIRQRRKELNMTQDELAQKLGYKDRSTIAKIESGLNDLTQSKIFAFANALSTTSNWLMGGNDTPPPTKESGSGAVSDTEAAISPDMIAQLRQLTPSELALVFAFIQGLLAQRKKTDP